LTWPLKREGTTLTEHLLLVEQHVFDAYSGGLITQHEVIDYGIWEEAISIGDTIKVQVITGSDTVILSVVDMYRKKLHDITEEEIARAGFPDMMTNGYGNPSMYSDATSWFSRVWDRRNPFKNTRWVKNPSIIIYVLKEN